MAKPVILAVDDDPEVLRAIERDLRRQYSERFRVLRADSGSIALDTLRQLQERNGTVALFLVDQRMPQMSGVEFLSQAMALFPDAKRALLTAYADTDAAIKAINEVKLDHYLMKPWDPPEEQLYPVLDDMLEDWLANYRPPFEGIRVIGNRWSPASHAVKDFLARNQVPYLWQDIEQEEEARRLVEQVEEGKARVPLVMFPDGTRLVEPTNAQLAEKVGMNTRASLPFYDLAIIGGGPAGLAAAVYGASEGLKTVMIERDAPGGQAGQSSRIENYLGFPSGLSGGDLARRAVAQARRFGVEVLTSQEATELCIKDPYRIVALADGSQISCHALLLATGVAWRKLDVPGLEKLTGAGVYYGAAITEALACKGEDVYVVGGANSAGQAAMYFSRFARNVTMLVRGPDLSRGMSDYLVAQIEDTPNISVRFNASVVEAHGDTSLEAISIHDALTGETHQVPATSLFIFIGAEPPTEWLEGMVMLDKAGYVLTGTDVMVDGKRPRGWTLDRDPFLLETSVPGIFAAGDVRRGGIKRVAAAVGEGGVSISFVHQYLRKVGA